MEVATPAPPLVKHFRQVLLWPLRLMALATKKGSDDGVEGTSHARPWEVLRELSLEGRPGGASPWREVVDEYTGSADQFHERHYNEFVTFLPYVQRFLYGEGRMSRDGMASGDSDESSSPMRVFRRKDVVQVRVTTQPEVAPITLDIVHTDLYFFLDVDLVLLNVEVSASDLTLRQAQECLYRFGRGYPAGWDKKGLALHCMANVEWWDLMARF